MDGNSCFCEETPAGALRPVHHNLLTDGIIFIAGNGQMYTRDEVLMLNAQERAKAGRMPIGLTTELLNRQKNRSTRV